MPVVGIAEIEVRPSFKGSQQAIGKMVDGSAAAAGASAGKTMGSRLGGALALTTKATAGVALAGLGVALTKGFSRLQAIENAKASLTGLGHSAESVTEIMNNATASVKGTAFGLGDAAGVAAAMVAAGIKPGKDLQKTLTLVGDAATIAGTDIGSMGAIFGKAAASNKVQMDVINQLHDAGVPALAMLADQMGVTAAEASKMASDGKIDFATFEAAMTKGLGGAALESGKTLQGAFANTMASVGRIGANLLSGVYPLFTKFFSGLITWMEPIEAQAKVVGAAIAAGMETAANAVGGLYDVLVKGDFTTRFREAFNVEEDSKLVDFLFTVREGFQNLVGFLQGAGAILLTGNFIGSSVMGFDEDSRIVDFLFRLHEGFVSIGTAVGQLKFSSWEAFKSSLSDAGGTVGGAFSSIFESLHTLAPAFEEFGRQLPNITGALMKLGGLSLNVIVAGLSFLADNVDTIIKWMPAIVAGFVAWRIATKLLAGAQFSLQAAQVAMAPVLLANNILRYASIRAETALSVATGQTTAVTQTSLAMKIKDRIATVVGTAVTWASVAAQKAAALATKALGVAVKIAMGPVGWIIAGITLLVAGLVWFFTQTDLGKDIVKNAFALIQKAAAAVVQWWNDTLLPALKVVGEWFADVWNGAVDVVTVAVKWIQDAVANVVDWWNTNLVPALNIIGEVFAAVWDGAAKAVQVAVQWIMDAAGNVASFFGTYVAAPIKLAVEAIATVFTWWYETIVKPVFDSVMVIVNGFYLFFRQAFLIVVEVFKQIIAPAFMNFWHGVVEPVFNGIGILISLWWAAVKLIFDTVVSFIKTTFSAAFTWLRDSVITPVFNFIKTAVTLWWAAVKLIFDSVVTFVRTVFSAAFTWLRDSVITPVFNFIKNAIDLWWTGTKIIFNAVISFIQTVFSAAFTWFRDSVITPVFNGIKWAIETWWTGVKFIFDTVIGFVRDTLGAAFTWLRDSVITPVWNGIKDTISNVWNNGIKPIFDFISNAIKDDVPKAFQTGVDAIKSIWEKIQDIAKAPVRFVINTVINDGLIAGMNKLGGLLGIAPLGNVGLPAGFRLGGYTGNYGYDTVAGVVHGNEHVIKAESRKSIEGKAPGFLEALNQHGAAALSKLGYRKGGRVNPTKHMGLTQGYSDVHKGIDIGVGVGTPVFSAEDGRVTHAGPGARAPGVWGGQEIHVLGNGVEQWFAHMSQIGVKVGQMVSAGQQIGNSGNTGITSGPHLHYGTFNGGWPNSFNPLPWLSGASAPEGGDSGSGWVDPFAALTKLADGISGKLKGAFPMGGFMVDAAAGMGKKMFTSVIDWAKDKLGMGAATGPSRGGHLNPLLYDQGGILRPGLSSIVNATGKPEAILNPQQWADIHRLATGGGPGGGRGDTNFYGNVGWNPDEVANRIETKRRDTFAAFGI